MEFVLCESRSGSCVRLGVAGRWWHAEDLEAIGLRETYRRVHVGQRTANCCFAVENAFLELLGIDDVDEVRSESIARCPSRPT